MPVTDVTTDPESLTMTLVADFPAPVERLWSVFTDPRQLDRFWGPPGWPATFRTHELTVGGHAQYTMRGPRGETASGQWEFLEIDEPRGFDVIDRFVTDDGEPLTEMPSMRVTFRFDPTPEGSRFTTVTYFESNDDLEKVVAMGGVEGSTLAINQLDVVLADLREYALGKGTRTEILTDTHVRITRLIEGPRDLVWRAHTEPALMKRWLLGPDGWEMTACEIGTEEGSSYRYAWAPTGDTEGAPFGFDGTVLLVDEPSRMVTTEHMTDTDYPSTTNDLSLYEEDGAAGDAPVTLLTLLIEYPDKATRDMVLATGMTEGMETSYARLEDVLENA